MFLLHFLKFVDILISYKQNLTFCLDTNNVTLSEVETEKLATLILSTDDELDKLLRSMDTATREDTISSLRSTVTSLLNNSTEFKFGDITNILDASVEKVKDVVSNQSTTNKTSSVPVSCCKLCMIDIRSYII